jgi:hypothetical protein
LSKAVVGCTAALLQQNFSTRSRRCQANGKNERENRNGMHSEECELAKCYGIAKEGLGFELGKRRILEQKRTQSDVYFHSDSVLAMTGEPHRRIGMISSQ